MQYMSSSKSDPNIRVRIAPSPTGYPHIGTMYQALFNRAYATKNQGAFVVRIEDTDRERLVEDAESKIYSALDWFGLTEDESPRKEGSFGPYKQSERLAIYQKYAQELLEKGGAFLDFYPKTEGDTTHKNDNPKTVTEMLNTQDWVLRLKVPKNTKIIVHDELRGDIEFDSNEVSEQVLLKSDGYPTYHLAVVVDDHLMEITDAVRGEEWISSFPKHQLIYQYLGWDMPRFYHTPLLRNPDHSKLSKRQGHTNVSWYQEEGYLKEAIVNFLSLLGWSHPQGKEIFSQEEFTNLVELKDLKAIGPIFDVQKLEWMNSQYLMNLDTETLVEKLKEFDSSLSSIDEETLMKLADIAKTRIKTLKEFKPLFEGFVFPTTEVPEKNMDVTSELKEELTKLNEWNKDNILETIQKVLKSHNLRFPDLYLSLTGKKAGPPLADTFEAIGKEKTLDVLGQS